MEKYFIKNGDSLPSIAEELGLTIDELMNFHNINSKLHDQINNMNLPKWSDHILIPDSIENLKYKKHKKESSNTISFPQKEIESTRYVITQKIDMQVSGNSMIDSETEILWNHKKTKNGNSFLAHLKQESHEVKYIKSIYRALAEYMQKFNEPLENLVLKLSEKGNIEELTNQQEINQRWQSLKKELTPQLGNTLEEQNMLESGDKDFSESLPIIKNNTLYNLFFPDVYKEHEISDTFNEEEKKSYVSQIFSNEKVNITTKKKVEKEHQMMKIKLLSEQNHSENDHLKSIYNEKLKPFFQEEYKYSFTWAVEYHYDIQTGKMISCNSKIKEQTGSSYSYVMEHVIELKKN
ncbi:hypothetical protein [Chryseobacterium taiwanense]|uniref:LysM domain-containing protein n=1 Tax=Chryseobacterium taiwanense TaxID=363331 RepID=A0A0B4D7Q2_9FLAO|nr:hypothetical protein [Chryseobacterium taiwanense]KIC64777.1 hypothetical protein RM51_02355 [Chryseobacterium taiwanense]